MPLRKITHDWKGISLLETSCLFGFCHRQIRSCVGVTLHKKNKRRYFESLKCFEVSIYSNFYHLTFPLLINKVRSGDVNDKIRNNGSISVSVGGPLPRYWYWSKHCWTKRQVMFALKIIFKKIILGGCLRCPHSVIRKLHHTLKKLWLWLSLWKVRIAKS